MERYAGKNIYKVSNPPGGQSSFKIGWDQPVSNPVKSRNLKNNDSNIYDRPSRNQPKYNEPNRSFIYEPSHMQKSRMAEQ